MKSEIKKAIFSFLAARWTETEIFYQRQKSKIQDSDKWLCVYVQDVYKSATRLNFVSATYNVNFSLFSNEDNAYALESLEDTLAEIFENRTIESERFCIQFREFATVEIEEQGSDLEKTISHKSINVTVNIRTK